MAKNNLRGWLTKERKIMGLADFHCPGSEHKITKQKIWCDKLSYIFSRTPSTEKSIAILQSITSEKGRERSAEEKIFVIEENSPKKYRYTYLLPDERLKA